MEQLKSLNIFCPYCGQNTVKETEQKDYYCGNTKICLSCKKAFYLSESFLDFDDLEEIS